MPRTPSKSSSNYLTDVEILDKVRLRCAQLKDEINIWMRSFEHKYARTASKTDLKNDRDAYILYKKYKLYKNRETELVERQAGRRAKDSHKDHHKDNREKNPTSEVPSTPIKKQKSSESEQKAPQYVARAFVTPKKRHREGELVSTPSGAGATTAIIATTTLTTPNGSNTNDSSPSKSPSIKLPIAVGPTPQLNGRALGIFDLKTPRRLFPAANAGGDPSSQVTQPTFETPTKRNSNEKETENEHVQSSSSPARPDSELAATVAEGQSSPVTTPIKPPRTPLFVRQVPETPSSETPGYFKIRAVMPAGSADSDSPIAPRKLSRTISSIVADIQNMSDLSSDDENIENDDNDKDDDFLGETKEPDDELNPTNTRKYVKKGAKRSTRRVLMRPVDSTEAPSMGKPTENFRRLKLHNSGYKGTVRRPPWKR